MEIKRNEAKAIAKALYAEGYFFSEAYPMDRWLRRGWPSMADALALYPVIDAFLKLFREIDKYEESFKKK